MELNKKNKGKVQFSIYPILDGKEKVKSFFVKTLEMSIDLAKMLKKGDLIPLKVFAENCEFLKKGQGEISDVRKKGSLFRILVETKSLAQDLRDCLIPNGWEEVSG